MKKRVLSLLLAVLIVVPMFGFVSSAAFETSGTCGTNVRWQLDSDYCLTITGNGEMDDYGVLFYNGAIYATGAPWGYYYHSIKSVVIKPGVTSIGNNAFNHCSSLTSIIIPNSVTSIGDNAFTNCGAITEVYFDGSAEEWSNITGNDVLFSANIHFSDTTTVIDSGTCGDSVTWTLIETWKSYSEPSYYYLIISGNGEMDSYSSSNYNGGTLTTAPWRLYNNTIKSVIIEAGVTSIGNYAFYNCNSFESITIPDSVTSIGHYAFSYCSSLTSVTIPDSVTSIDDYAFLYCDAIKELTIGKCIENGNPISSTNLKSVTILDGVTKIPISAFYNCSSLTSVTIPDSVTSIGNSAFYNCSSLTSATIPDSVTSIGNSAFKNCSKLTSINIPNSVTSIGESAFDGCNAIIELTIGKYLVKNGNPISSTKLKNVTVLDGVTKIPEEAFGNCSSLESVTLPEGVTSIGRSAFYGCSKLTSVTIPDSVRGIGDSAFSGCSLLASITIPDRVTSIGRSAFYGCSKLTSVIIPDSLRGIGDYAFRGCSSLTSVTIGNNVTSIGDYAFEGCSLLKNVYYTGSVAEWCNISFSGYYSNPNCYAENFYITGDPKIDSTKPVTSITIPDSVTSIGDSTFWGCSSLESVTIPDSVTSIGDYAFYDCSSLADVYYGGSEEEWDNISISSTENDDLCFANIHYNYHEHDYISVVTEPTCTEPGYTTHTCSICGDTYTDNETNPLGHSYNSVVTVPTCTEPGYTTHTCSRCGDTYTDNETNPNGHSYVSNVTKAPTCTEKGIRTYTCLICNDSYEVDIPANGHSYTSVVTEPTYTTKGYTTYTCSVCGDSYIDDETDIIPHTHTYTTQITAPTCTEAGYTTYTCSICGESYTADQVSALGHNWDGGAITTLPTSSSDGVLTYTCGRCGEVKTAAISMPSIEVTDVEPEPVLLQSGSLIGSNVTATPGQANRFTLVENADESVFKDWYADFTVSFSNDIESADIAQNKAGQAILYGNYGSWGNVPMFIVTKDGNDLPANTEYRLLQNLAEQYGRSSWGNMTYKELVTYGVSPFNCGIITSESDTAVNAAAPGALSPLPEGTEITIKFNLYENADGTGRVLTVAEKAVEVSHDYVASVTAPTCTEPGYTTYTCSICGDTYTETVPAAGHHYVAEVTAPTPDAQGYTTYTCSVCGDSYVSDYTDFEIPEDAPKVIVESVTGIKGGTITVPIKLENNPGIITFRAQVSYDSSKLELIGKNQTLSIGDYSYSRYMTDVPYSIYWDNSLGDNYTGDGAILELVFKIKDDIEEGKTDITITYDEEEVFNFDLDNVFFYTVNGTVDITHIPGDVNSDGKVNAKDVTILTRYINNWAGVTINTLAADINKDGTVNPKDVTLLRRHLNGWEGIL